MSPFKTSNLNSVVDLSQAVDEKLPESLTSLGYTESFTITDTKLAIGYLSAVIAAGTYYLEKKFKFEEVFHYTAILVGLYFLLSALNWYYSKFIAKKVIYKGNDKRGNTLEISGVYDKYIPEYKLSFKLFNKDGKAIEFNDVLKFTQVFDAFGTLRQDLLDEYIKNTVERNILTKNK